MRLQLRQKNEHGIVFHILDFNDSETYLNELSDLVKNTHKRYIDMYTYVVNTEVNAQFLILHTDSKSLPTYEVEQDKFIPVNKFEDIPENKRIDDKYRKMLGV